jgi:hypothetical protein
MNIRSIFIALLGASVLAACGSSEENNHDHNNEELTPADDACEHMAGGPSEAITATAPDGDPPSIADSHTRFDVTLADDDQDGTYTGRLLFESTEEDEAHFFVDQKLTLTLLDSSDMELSPAETIAETPCDEVAQGWAFEVGVGSYALDFEAAAEEISVVYVPSGAEHEHEE